MTTYHGQSSLMGHSPQGCKSWTRLSRHTHIHIMLYQFAFPLPVRTAF